MFLRILEDLKAGLSLVIDEEAERFIEPRFTKEACGRKEQKKKVLVELYSVVEIKD